MSRWLHGPGPAWYPTLMSKLPWTAPEFSLIRSAGEAQAAVIKLTAASEYTVDGRDYGASGPV